MFNSIYVFSCLIFSIALGAQRESTINGTIANGWEFVHDLFQDNFVRGDDLGASMAIYHQGNLVAHLWGGHFDSSQTKPYDRDTLQLVFSTTKGLVAIAVAMCVERGLLDYSAPVIKYWPKYGQYGKENTTVADILSHRAGLHNDTEPFESFWNWAVMIQSLEQRPPTWQPGSKHGYHALTYGWLAGELVRRVDPQNRTLGQFIRDEIAVPLGIEFYVGLPAQYEYRVSPLNVKPPGGVTQNQSTPDPFPQYNDHRTHQAEIPAANGITNALSVARLYASLLGDVEGGKYRRLLTEATLKLATKSNTPPGELDATLLVPTDIAMGFFLLDAAFATLGPGVFGHSGFGGSIGLAVPSKQLSFAYVVNRLNTDSSAGTESRYRLMLEKVATKINNHGASVHCNLSFCLLLPSTILFLLRLLNM